MYQEGFLELVRKEKTIVSNRASGLEDVPSHQDMEPDAKVIEPVNFRSSLIDEYME